MSRKVREIVTRFPNLECGFLAGLLAYCERVRRHLEITTGRLLWDFISTAKKIDSPDEDPEVVYFNVGRGHFDQHGKPENESLCKLCSLDLIRDSYDFLVGRPWLRDIFGLVRANDIRGERISSHPFNLRELMTALSYNYKDNPQLVLDWLSLAFCGVFEGCKAGIPIKKIFNPEEMIKGVALHSPPELEWFEELLQEAISTVKRHNSWAQKAVRAAEVRGRNATVYVPSLKSDIKVIEVFCDSFKTGAAGRQAGYQIVIQWNKDGHCQIHGGHIKIEETVDIQTMNVEQFLERTRAGESGDEIFKTRITKKWAHMGEVAKQLRFLEAKFRGRKIKEGQDWTKSGIIIFAENDTPIPWYLAEFLTSLYNGTMSSADIPPTAIGRKKLFEAVCKSLPKCLAVIQVGSNEREVVGLARV
ncbi:MAG: hypothetical protein Q7K65_05830 [Candidatus Buchananbacteria bacterium]|nr:hypothetical protein [Candidatus Buchananbacteria bacterium]